MEHADGCWWSGLDLEMWSYGLTQQVWMGKVQDLAVVFSRCPLSRTGFGCTPVWFQNLKEEG